MSPDRARACKKSRAFTLIELMVVILIIGILVAAVLVGVPKIKRAVYGAQTQAQLSALAAAIQQYYNDYKAYPGPLANNQLAPIFAGVSRTNTANSPNADGFLLRNIPNTNTGYSWTTGATLNPNQITGAENLVLGLCGGLRLTPPGTSVNGVTSQGSFGFYLEDIYGTDGITPAPKGPSSLNPNLPKKQQAYIVVKPGDLSPVNLAVNQGRFTDSAGRGANDSLIPEFMDKYADPLPILYFRANVGGGAMVGIRKVVGTITEYVDDSNNVLQDTSAASFAGNPVPETAQYDLVQNMGYTKSLIGTIFNKSAAPGGAGSKATSFHGLQGLGTSANLSDPIDTSNPDGTYSPFHLSGATTGTNAIAYFKDPTLNDPVNSTNVHQGTARQKDGYVLISAGADRLYGTHDDQIFPGPLVPAQ